MSTCKLFDLIWCYRNIHKSVFHYECYFQNYTYYPLISIIANITLVEFVFFQSNVKWHNLLWSIPKLRMSIYNRELTGSSTLLIVIQDNIVSFVVSYWTNENRHLKLNEKVLTLHLNKKIFNIRYFNSLNYRNNNVIICQQSFK